MIDAEQCVSRGNHAIGNAGNGFQVSGARNLLVGNVASGQGSRGFDVTGESHVLRSNKAVGNSIGLSVGGDTHKALGNVLSGNQGDGLDAIFGDGQRITGNRAHRNGFVNGVGDGAGYGISVAAALTNLTAKANVAHGNDNPDECSVEAGCN